MRENGAQKNLKSLEDLDFGLSPSGKAQDFDSCISLVRIQLAQFSSYGMKCPGLGMILWHRYEKSPHYS